MKNNTIQPLVTIKGLSKAFQSVSVLEDIDLAVHAGEVVSLVGKSGAGKTTVLRCIMGLERGDKGSIYIDGKPLCHEENGVIKRASRLELYEIRKSLAMVFQNYHLFPHLSVLDNVTLALTQVYKMEKTAARTKAATMLESLGLGEKQNNKPFELSGGQKQRVAIARSCVTNPKLLCFDEPTAALDSALVGDMIQIIREFASGGMGILIISHDENFVRDVSDRILFMENGKIKTEMTPDQYKERIR